MVKQSQLLKFGLLAFILAVVVFVVFHQNVSVRMFLPKYYQCKYRFRQNFTNAMNDYRRCLLKILRPHKDMFKQLQSAVDQCVDKELWKKLDIKNYHNGDEPKMAMLAKPGQSCVEVTLGVGNNIRAEQQLKKAVPQCQLFGADPILASGRVFRDVGQYFEIAVGASAGVFSQNVLENGYQKKNFVTVDFMEFLTKYVNTSSVDFMLMDNEGPEYEIFPKYLIDSPPPVRICQLNAEMHGPLEKYNMNASKFNELIESILTKSQFLPFHSTTGWGHLQTFYVNVDDTACVDKFILYKFCDSGS